MGFVNLHVGQFPNYRPRRLRQSAAMRRLVAETSLNVSQLVLPLFVRGGRKLRHPINSMPGVFQFSPDEILREAASAHALGVPAVLLFGIPDKKDAKASGAYAKNGIVQQTVRLLKKELPSLLVITDVCLCEYMAHGHCGVGRENFERSDVEAAGANGGEPCGGGRGHRRAERHDGRSRSCHPRGTGQK
jgi:porphobilinogen synthase